MSFSFAVQAASKELALAACATEMGRIVERERTHAHDAKAVLETVERQMALLPDDGTRDVAVTCSGYMSWSARPETYQEMPPVSAFTGASVSVNVHLVGRRPLQT